MELTAGGEGVPTVAFNKSMKFTRRNTQGVRDHLIYQESIYELF